MTFRIIAFTPAHTSQILALSMRAWAPVFGTFRPAVQDYVYANFYPEGWEVRQATDIGAFLEDEGDRVWLAMRDDALLGWVGIRIHAEDSMGEIYVLAVDPDHQRQGVAAALMDFAMERMRAEGMKMVMVETGDDPGHAPSRATYESAGFTRWPVARYFREL